MNLGNKREADNPRTILKFSLENDDDIDRDGRMRLWSTFKKYIHFNRK